MSRPTERFAELAAKGSCDEDRGEFWIGNPWRVNGTKRNLSAYEPNQVFLNLGGMKFATISYLTAADSDGDGRGVLVADVDRDLHPDLIVRQSGGGPLRVYANRFPATRRLEVSLRGTKSNSLGIGARVVAEIGGREIVRQLYPANNFIVSQAAIVRFGLGDAETVDKLTIHWPSGAVQHLKAVPTNVHIRVTEGKAAYETLLRATNER